MQNKGEVIEHAGFITSIDGDQVKVTIGTVSACSACHAKGACGASDMQDKVIDVKKPEFEISVGDAVTVVISKSLGYLALFLGYLLPLILILTFLIVLSELGYSELIAGVVSLGIVVPYYFILYLFRNRLKKTYAFSIKKN